MFDSASECTAQFVASLLSRYKYFSRLESENYASTWMYESYNSSSDDFGTHPLPDPPPPFVVVREAGPMKHGTTVIGENAGIARGLSSDQLAEGERPIGDLQVLLLDRRDLEEDSLGRSALVELACRMQEARAPAERHGALGPSSKRITDLDELGECDAVDVSLDRDVAIVGEVGQ